MAVTSANTETVDRAAARRREFHLRRIRVATSPRSKKWQSIAWLHAELKPLGDRDAAAVVRAFAAQLNRGEMPDLTVDGEVTR